MVKTKKRAEKEDTKINIYKDRRVLQFQSSTKQGLFLGLERRERGEEKEGSFRKEVNSCDVNPNQGSKKEGHRAFPWEITGLEA